MPEGAIHGEHTHAGTHTHTCTRARTHARTSYNEHFGKYSYQKLEEDYVISKSSCQRNAYYYVVWL